MPVNTYPHFVPIWRIAPFIRIVIPLILGIIIARWVVFNVVHSLFLLGSGIIIFSVAFLSARRFPMGTGISIFFLWVVFGVALYTFAKPENKVDFIEKGYRPGEIVSATIITPLEEKERTFKVEAGIRQWDTVAGRWQNVYGNIIIYFSKEINKDSIGFGSMIAFSKQLEPIRNSGNPGAFNYRQFAADRNLFYSVFLTHDDFVLPTMHYKKSPIPWYTKARDFLLTNIRTYIPDEKSAGVAAALLCGYRLDMDRELTQQYSATGVAHIIAISGLHLGLLMQGMLFFFSLLKPLKKYSKVIHLMVIIFLWAFAFITGAGPSVLRSALMFSILLFGKVIGREGNSWNSLAASAFFILLFSPVLLFDVGFQLSYSAMLSIFMFSRPIGSLVKTDHRFIKYFWTLISATTAAQILTLPFVVFYFKQFPVYFILSNLVAVSLSTLALYGAFIMAVLVWFINPLAGIIGWMVSKIIGLMNGFVKWVYELPFSRVEHLYITLGEAVLLMAIIGLLSAWVLLKHKTSFVAGIFCLSFFIAQREYTWYKHGKQQLLVIYNINRVSALDIINGHTALFYGEDDCMDSVSICNNTLAQTRRFYRVKKSQTLQGDTSGFKVITIGKRKLLVLDKEPDLLTSEKVTVDWLFIDTNLKARPGMVLEKITCQTIILGTKLPLYKVEQWHSAVDSLPLRLHSLREDGAFVYDFDLPG